MMKPLPHHPRYEAFQLVEHKDAEFVGVSAMTCLDQLEHRSK